jgi:hypothetical protein
MQEATETAKLLAELIHADLHKCLAGLDCLGSSFAAAHLSAAIESLRSDYKLPESNNVLSIAWDSDLSPMDDMIDTIVAQWESPGFPTLQG